MRTVPQAETESDTYPEAKPHRTDADVMLEGVHARGMSTER